MVKSSAWRFNSVKSVFIIRLEKTNSVVMIIIFLGVIMLLSSSIVVVVSKLIVLVMYVRTLISLIWSS